MQTKWGNPVSIRFHREKDKEIRKIAKSHGLTVGMYIRTIVYKEITEKA